MILNDKIKRSSDKPVKFESLLDQSSLYSFDRQQSLQAGSTSGFALPQQNALQQRFG